MVDHYGFSNTCAQSPATVSDLTHAWSCATSFTMCQAGYAPHPMPGVIRLALVNVHAQQLLLLTRADPGRLDTLAELCRRRAGAALRRRGGWTVARRRGSLRSSWSPTRWVYVFGATTRASRADVAAHWMIAAELAEAASAMVRSDGADICVSARARLVAQAGRDLRQIDWTQFRGCAGPGGGDPQMAPRPARATTGWAQDVSVRVPRRPAAQRSARLDVVGTIVATLV